MIGLLYCGSILMAIRKKIAHKLWYERIEVQNNLRAFESEKGNFRAHWYHLKLKYNLKSILREIHWHVFFSYRQNNKNSERNKSRQYENYKTNRKLYAVLCTIGDAIKCIIMNNIKF